MCTTWARHASLCLASHGRGARECCRDSSWLRRSPALASPPAKLRVEMAAEKWEMAGEVGIDTGGLLLIDPGYVSELGRRAVRGVRDDRAGGGGEPVHTYPVRVLRTKDGAIAAVRVDFLPGARQLPASGSRAMPASAPGRRAVPLNAQRI